MPKRRAASRWLSPSTWQAWQTRPYSSTENIPALSGPWRASPKKAMTRYSFVPARPDYPVASVAYFSTAALKRWEFVFQPKYAAYLNLIEPWWKILRSLALKGRRFEAWPEIE